MEILEHGYGITTETDAFRGAVKRSGKVVKRYRGETAWMDAERHARDLATEARQTATEERHAWAW